MSALDYIRYFPQRTVREVRLGIVAACVLLLGTAFCSGVLADRVWHLL